MSANKIILWEYQKKRVCEFYGCSDLHGNQYPKCIYENDKMGIEPKPCHLHRVNHLIDKLNEPQKEGDLDFGVCEWDGLLYERREK